MSGNCEIGLESPRMFRRGVPDFATAVRFIVMLSLLAASASPAVAAPAAEPDFGPHVFVFNPLMPVAEVQRRIDKVYAIQEHSECGPARDALICLTVKYNVDVPVGFYTEA